jgi:potassium/hydrogen antiporter
VPAVAPVQDRRVVEGIAPFALVLLVASSVVLLALLSNQASHRLRVPGPGLFLVMAAVAADLFPTLRQVPVDTVEQIVTVALVLILFDGGMHIGLGKLRTALGSVLTVGVLGTFLTAAALAVLAHLAAGLPWPVALLVGTALAPTDPAVVFSVLGNWEIEGRTGVLLEGESGANDPVGIALLVSLLGAGSSLGLGAAVGVLGEFALQMLVGGVVGVGGGYALRTALRHLPLPSGGLYPLLTLAAASGLYGLATVAAGSGFLAVFVAGIVLGDAATPFKADVERFHASLASLSEIIAFVVLGATVSVSELVRGNAWLIGLLLAVLLTLVVRPLAVGPLLLATRLRTGERLFVLWSGLKGAVPILLGTYLLASEEARAYHAYEIIVVVVAFSVIVQGGLVPTMAARLRVPMREVEPRPWALGVRLRDQPTGAHRYRITAGAPADGRSVRDLHLGEDIWISLVVRGGRSLRVRGETTLRSGDEVLLLTDPGTEHDLAALFTAAP